MVNLSTFIFIDQDKRNQVVDLLFQSMKMLFRDMLVDQQSM